jgi:hypothetical protein
MANKDVRLFQGGSAEQTSWVHCEDTPQYFGPPFGGPRHRETPLGNNPYDAAAPRPDFVASEPLNPRRYERQMNAFRDSRPAAGNIIQLVIVPVNHYLHAVRVDVAEPDPLMVGATVSITGQIYEEETNEPFEDYTLAEAPEFAAAATAQGLADIPLDVRGSHVLWMTKVTSGYAVPHYVPPVARTTGSGEIVLLERGALILGLKIKTLPTNQDVGIQDMAGPIFMAGIISGFAFKHTTA